MQHANTVIFSEKLKRGGEKKDKRGKINSDMLWEIRQTSEQQIYITTTLGIEKKNPKVKN